MAVVEETNPNIHLAGNKWPVADERDDVALQVRGELPVGLEGVFVRNGPNPVVVPGERYHIFDGDGMLHALTIRDGVASYRNRWVRTAGFEMEQAAGRQLFGGMTDLAGTDRDAAKALADKGEVLKNVANTHVVEHAGRVLALWEAGLPYEVTRELDTVGRYDFGGALQGPMTAHPKFDARTGEMVFFGYQPFPPYLRLHTVDATGALVRSVDIDIPNPVMIHDFAVTDRYAVFLDAPAVFDLRAGLAGDPFVQWRPEVGCRVGVVARDATTDTTRWFDVEPGYVFHFLNAFDDGDTVHLDGCRQDGFNMAQSPEEATNPARTPLTRFSVDLTAGTARVEQLDDRSGDFPRTADAVAGRPYRYGYVATLDERSGFGDFTSVTKYDLANGASESFRYGAADTTGEVVFAAAPDGVDEDDGWLLSWVHDHANDASRVVILDARAPSAGPVAEVLLPRRVPFGFHGSWLPSHD
ncbi:MAG TPA: carotenoid oxygenase family protein [Acidimicrobiales bacterium]|nr:carotenoid oxygenase family protein [Acidimicrobiales bacterium]